MGPRRRRTRSTPPRVLRQGWLQGIRHWHHAGARSNARSPLTCHPAQPACVCRQALQILLGPNQDGLAAEPANRSGVELGAGGRQASLARRRQGSRSGRQQGRRRAPVLPPARNPSPWAMRRCASSGRPRMPIAGRGAAPGWAIAPCSCCNLVATLGASGHAAGPRPRRLTCPSSRSSPVISF